MFRASLLLSTLLSALPSGAQTVRNDDIFSAALHDGPSATFPVLGRLVPGAVADLGRCVDDGSWCLVSTDAQYGWVEMSGLTTTGPGGAVEPILPGAPIFEQVLPGPDDGPSGDLTAGFETGTFDFEPDASVPGQVFPVPEVRTVIPRMFSTTEPFRNVSTGLVNLRAGPGTEYEVIGQLRPGEGAPIDVCDVSESWCRLDAPGARGAWVKMTFMGLRRLDNL